MKIPKIEYDIYCKFSGSYLRKLNLSVCENTKIDLFIPVEISENVDKLNSSSDYYNDICYTATSDTGTDISLKDRKKEFSLLKEIKQYAKMIVNFHNMIIRQKRQNVHVKFKKLLYQLLILILIEKNYIKILLILKTLQILIY